MVAYLCMQHYPCHLAVSLCSRQLIRHVRWVVLSSSSSCRSPLNGVGGWPRVVTSRRGRCAGCVRRKEWAEVVAIVEDVVLLDGVRNKRL